mmetsp:Transcript_100073/g.280410  ORF Transcript_100073/g.280410 Transcript_100073/m.280410 type:complete len:320 (-) Transcript_100073:1250-2209(-)
MAGSKHVASSTPKLRARTAQCDKMSGASFAERTSTPTTPSGTSSSPLTAPLRSTVGVSKTLSWMLSILSMRRNSPCTGLSTGEIICHGGRCAKLRNTGSKRWRQRLTAMRDVPRSTSSTKTSMLRFGAPTCSPRKVALGPMSTWHLSHNSPTTRLVLSTMAFNNKALSTGPFHFCCAHSPAKAVQSAKIAWSSSSMGKCPTKEVARHLSWSHNCTMRFSDVMPCTSTLCCVSREKSRISSSLITCGCTSRELSIASMCCRASKIFMNLPWPSSLLAKPVPPMSQMPWSLPWRSPGNTERAWSKANWRSKASWTLRRMPK